MSKRVLSILALIVVASFLLVACGGSTFECEDALGCVSYAEGEAVRIASALVITGPNTQLGLDSQYGVEVAMSFQGDLFGHPIELQAEDDGCNAEGGQSAGQKITSDPSIVAIVGTSCSGAGVAMSSVVSAAGYSMISPSNTSPFLTDPDVSWNPGYYRTAHNDNVQGAAVADFAYNELGLRTAAAIHDGDPYTEGLANAFRVSFEALGGEMTAFTAVVVGDTDMRPVLTEIASGGPDFIFSPLFTAECAHIAKQVGEIVGLEDTVLAAADGCISADAAAAIGEASEGMYFSGPDISFSGSLYDDFKVEYNNISGEDLMSVFHAHAFDATRMIFACIEEVGIEDGEALYIGRQALRDCLGATTDFTGITGSLTCNDYGDCADPKITLSVINADGEYEAIWP